MSQERLDHSGATFGPRESAPVIDEIVNISVAAELLHVHHDTLRKWENNGKMIARRHPMTGYRIYERSAIEQLASEILRGGQVHPT